MDIHKFGLGSGLVHIERLHYGTSLIGTIVFCGTIHIKWR